MVFTLPTDFHLPDHPTEAKGRLCTLGSRLQLRRKALGFSKERNNRSRFSNATTLENRTT